MRQIGIGIAGLGTVGAGVYKHVAQNRALLCERLGVELVVRRAIVRDVHKPRVAGPPAAELTTRWQDLIDDPDVQIVVELMGGIDESLALIRAAINAGKIVVTGNKALLAEHGQEIFALAAHKKVPVFFEASTAGGIPIIKTIREALVANHIVSIHGIINGTSNYILTRMTDAGLDFAEALAEAQAHGYAEADPTFDINGWDAAHKAIILASLAYGFWVGTDKIFVEGIDKLTATDIRFADELGYRVKLLAIIKADASLPDGGAGNSGGIEVRVHPTLIPKTHVLASVSGVFNAVAVRGDVVGETLFYGRGAGQDPTASAVISDLAEAAIALGGQHRTYGFTPHGLYGTCKPLEDVRSRYYLRLAVDDRPGVLAQVAGIVGQHDIGISSVVQPETHDAADRAQLVFMLAEASERQMQAALADILQLACVTPPPALLRVESFS